MRNDIGTKEPFIVPRDAEQCVDGLSDDHGRGRAVTATNQQNDGDGTGPN